jgi:hypothetical protein
MANTILYDAVAQRRADFPEQSAFLTDWQVHSANLVMSAISMKAIDNGMDEGPRYLPFPTGSGKTIGAIWGVIWVAEEYPEKRLCFLTPYQASVDQVYAALVKRLGEDVVGMYYSGAFVDKAHELQKRIVVLTHQFVPYNKGALDDRDIFVVDEAIYSTANVSLRLDDFSHALSWATSTGTLTKEFEQAHTFAIDLYGRLKEEDKKRFYAPIGKGDYPWAKTIADLNLAGPLGQTLNNIKAIAGVKVFCEALDLGLVFLARGTTTDITRYNPTFNAAVLGIPRLDHTVVLTATGGLIYDIAGPIQESNSSKDYAVPATYQQVTLGKLSDPNIKGNYKSWTTEAIRTVVCDYLDWLLPQILEDEAYVSMPLAVYKGCLRAYFDLGSGDINLPLTRVKHGKTLHLSHHQLSIGSNNFKDCPAVIYLWPSHLPKRVILQDHIALEGKRLTDERLFVANSRMKDGPFAQMSDARYLDNIIQQIGRGRVRQIDDNGRAGQMTAYLLVRPLDFERLRILMPEVQTTTFEGFGDLKRPVGRKARIISYLNDHRGEDILISDVVKATGIEAKNIKTAVTRDESDVVLIGFRYVAGVRGRGTAAKFKWSLTTDNDIE